MRRIPLVVLLAAACQSWPTGPAVVHAQAVPLTFEGLVRQPNAWYVKPDSPLVEASVCSKQDEDGAPADTVLVLSADTGRIGLYFKIEGGPDPGQLKLGLDRDDQPVHRQSFAIKADKRSIWWVEPKTEWTLPEGVYTFRLALNAELLAALDFVVVSAPELDGVELPEPEYTDTPPPPPPPPPAPEAEPEEHAEVALVTEQPEEAAPEESALPAAQQDLIAAAVEEARGRVKEVGDDLADEVLDELRSGKGQFADAAANLEALPGDVFSEAKADVSASVSALTEDTLKKLQTDLLKGNVGGLSANLLDAVTSGSKQGIVDSMVDSARKYVKESVTGQAVGMLGKLGGGGGLLGTVLDVAAGGGIGTAVKLVSGLFGGGSRGPTQFFVCKTDTAQQLAERMLEADGLQAALQACGGRQPVCSCAAGTSNTSKFGRGVLLIPLAAQANDEAVSALLIVENVSVSVNGARVETSEGFPFTFRGGQLYALPLVCQPNAGDQSLLVLGQGGANLVAASVKTAVPEARARDPYATVHQVIPQDTGDKLAVAVCSLTPSLDSPTGKAGVFMLGISPAPK